MGYTVSYKGMSRDERRYKGFSDAVDYLGAERMPKVWEIVGDILKATEVSFRVRVNQCYFALSFAGLQGVPAWAIIKTRLAVLKMEQKQGGN